MTVKIRDLAKISPILERAGTLGANQISGLSFTIEEPKLLAQEARLLAIGDAKEKASKLAGALNVRLGKVVSFYEEGGSIPPPVPVFTRGAIGGEVSVAPQIETGTTDVISNVTVTYEIE